MRKKWEVARTKESRSVEKRTERELRDKLIMIQTISKHVRWRKDRREILICDCKRLIDLKLPLEYGDFMKKVSNGIKDKDSLTKKERLAFLDLEKMGLLSSLEVRPIREEEFENLAKILDEELGKERVRNKELIREKFRMYPELFIGVFLGKDLIGAICGFPREDYLLLSEIAVLLRFQGRGYGKMLIEYFENAAKGKYSRINAGAEDNAIGFYEKLGYRPFLLIQFEEGSYSKEDFSRFNIKREYTLNGETEIEVETGEVPLPLDSLKSEYPNAWFQYIFTKNLN